MRKIAALVLILSALFLSAASFVISSAPSAPPVTVPYVDIKKYLGLWYEQAVIPFFWERNCIKSTAGYSLYNNGSIRVDNKCERNGKVAENVGLAVPEESTNDKLKVEFVQTLDIGGQYWIVRLASDYSYSVVSDPDYSHMWILCR